MTYRNCTLALHKVGIVKLVPRLVDKWTVEAATFQSKGRNTPFEGWRLRGRAIATFTAGRPTFALAGTAAEALA